MNASIAIVVILAVVVLVALWRYQHRGKARSGKLRGLESALAAAQQQGDARETARLLNSIGAVHNDWGEKGKALAYFEEALSLSRQVGDRGGEETTLSNIGAIYDALGEKRKALEYYEQALPLLRQAEDRSGEATTLGSIGALYTALDEQRKALDYYEQALPLRTANGRPQRRGQSTQQHRQCLCRPGRTEQGAGLLRASPAAEQAGGRPRR